MDLNRVTAFVRVVRDGSFTSAAKSLGLPKSSVSRSVAQLEQDLGLRLLHRTTRRVHLTDAGSAYYDRVARALADIDEATLAAADMNTQLRGTVRLSAAVDLGVIAIAPAVARFVRKHPHIHVDVSLSPRRVDLVGEGFDLAVRAGNLGDSSLIARRVGTLEAALFASPKYIAKHGSPKRVADLASHECVLHRPVNGKSTWVLTDRDGAASSIEVKGRITVDDLMFTRTAILSGAGIGLVPEFLCARDEQRGLLARVLPEWRFQTADLNVVYPSARFVPQRVVVFREFLLEALGALVRRCEGARQEKGNDVR